jgi:hypothetical protein
LPRGHLTFGLRCFSPARLLRPLGRWWRETTHQLPATTPARWQHAITIDELDATKPAKTSSTSAPSLDFVAVLEPFPVALLIGSPTRSTGRRAGRWDLSALSEIIDRVGRADSRSDRRGERSWQM